MNEKIEKLKKEALAKIENVIDLKKLNDIITLKYFKNEDNKDSFVGYVNDETIFEAVLTMEE